MQTSMSIQANAEMLTRRIDTLGENWMHHSQTIAQWLPQWSENQVYDS